MSKLYDMYKQFKKEDNETLYLFKSGIFYIFLDEDANKMNKFLNLKLTLLTPTVVKCGFPVSSIDKYSEKLSNSIYNFKIIDPTSETFYLLKEFKTSVQIHKLVSYINNIDTNNLSIGELYTYIEELKKMSSNILEQIGKNF